MIGRSSCGAWRMEQELTTLTGHQDYVASVAFSPDGQWLASGGGFEDKTVRLWRALDGTLERSWKASSGAVTSVAFSPDGVTLASGGGRGDDSIGLWQVNQGTLLRKITGHSGSVLSVAFSPDGTRLVTGSVDCTLGMWRVADGTRLWGTQGGGEIGWVKGSLIVLTSAVLAFLIVWGLWRLIRWLYRWAKRKLRPRRDLGPTPA